MGGNFISILTSLLFRANLVRDEPYNLSEHSGNEGKYQSMKQHANMRTLKNTLVNSDFSLHIQFQNQKDGMYFLKIIDLLELFKSKTTFFMILGKNKGFLQ